MNEAECGGVSVVVGGGGGGGGGCGGGGGGVGAPKGDLNSNVSVIERSTTASCLSNASSQDVDFVQDNSDYQWFVDYGYRDGVQHAGILSSLAESYECSTSEGCYYETLSKNLDANLAEADMESFRTEDIHALLTTLPAMCAAVPAPGARDAFASVSGSMLAKFDVLASSAASSSAASFLMRADHSSGGADDSSSRADASPDTMSICKSELLFSPVKDTPMPGASFSVDSLDCDLDHDLMLTCHATNKDNYTIAFEGSIVTTCSADGDNETDDVNTMARSDSGLTTWSELRAAPLKRHPSGNNNNNNNNSTGEQSTSDEQPSAKSHSMPDLHQQQQQHQHQQQQSAGCVKLFDIQNQVVGGTTAPAAGSYYSDMAVSVDAGSDHATTSNPKFNLVKLYLRQRSASASAEGVGSLEGCPSEDSGCGEPAEPMERASERSESVERLSEDSAASSLYADNNNGSAARLHHLVNRSMQTSTLRPAPVRVVPPSFLHHLRHQQQPVYVVYPNYTLPDLGFLNEVKSPVADPAPDVHIVPKPKSGGGGGVGVGVSVGVGGGAAVRARRPFSCNDVETLKRRGFSHVRDWDSLTFLLPAECRQVLADVPELEAALANKRPMEEEVPHFCAPRRPRPVSCDCGSLTNNNNNNNNINNTVVTTASSSSSTATQPSSGYRGSSTMLSTDSSQTGAPAPLNPLLVYRYDSVTSSDAASVFERPPVVPRRSVSLRPPRGILRPAPDESKARKNLVNTKRYSAADTGAEADGEDDEEDEGVETGHVTDSSLDERFERAKARPPTPPLPRAPFDPTGVMNSCDELEQLEDFLRSSGALSDADDWDDWEVPRLRSHVARFLALKINRAGARKCVSFAPPPVATPLVLDTAIREEETGGSPPAPAPSPTADVSHKMSLVSTVTRAVERLVQHFSAAMNRSQLEALGDSERTPVCARLVISSLCPALYALLSDGLKQELDTPFGPIGNSVWQVVETTAQQGGPLTGALGDLVARVNAQDVSAEGLVKFNAFVCGLLNVRSLDAWAAYVRTRETALRRHYGSGALLLMAHTPPARSLLDALVAALRPLALLPFNLDLLYESRELHRSFRRLHLTHPIHSDEEEDEDESTATMVRRTVSPAGTSSQRSLPDLVAAGREERQRPRSCVAEHVIASPSDLAATVRKRWSGVSLGSKLVHAFERLADDTDDDYTDSLEAQRRAVAAATVLDTSETEPESEPVSLDNAPLGGGKFRRLQMKWEMLTTPAQQTSGTGSPPSSPSHAVPRSRIPRPVTSPVKVTSGIPVPLSPSSAKPVGGKPPPTPVTPPTAAKKPPLAKGLPARKSGAHPTRYNPSTMTVQTPRVSNGDVSSGYRASRLDQVDTSAEGRPHPVRPSSLPYRPVTGTARTSHAAPPRRAVSSSVTRKQQQQQQQQHKQQTKRPKVVRTLSHRLPSDNGHLSYNEGERLQVILEVDSRWLLCCRGERKGLVPRSGVIEVNDITCR